MRRCDVKGHTLPTDDTVVNGAAGGGGAHDGRASGAQATVPLSGHQSGHQSGQLPGGQSGHQSGQLPGGQPGPGDRSGGAPPPSRPLDLATWVAGAQLARCLNDRHAIYRVAVETPQVLPDQGLRTSLKLHVRLPAPGVAPGTGRAEILVPLLLVSKRATGVQAPVGAVSVDAHELPLLGSGEVDRIAAAAVLTMVPEQVRSMLGTDLWRRVFDLVASPRPAVNDVLVRQLQVAGETTVAEWAALLGQHRLVVALAPGDLAERRCVLNVSYEHPSWVPDETTGDLWDRLLAGWGRRPFRICVPGAAAASWAADHQFRVPELPAGLAFVAAERVEHRVEGDPEPWPMTRLDLALDRRGLLATVRVGAAVTCLVLGGVAATSGGVQAWRHGADGAAALLLAVPAIVLALLARPGDGALLARLTGPLRGAALTLAAVLLLAALCLLGDLHEPWLRAVWFTLSGMSGVLALLPGGGGRGSFGALRAVRGRMRRAVAS